MAAPWWPTTADVAALLTARTRGASGEEVGDFTADTRPTSEQVESLIEQSANLLTALTGGQDLPEGVATDAMRSLVSLRTAMSVELAFFSEQVGTDSSPFDKLQSMYRDEFDAVAKLVDIEISKEVIETDLVSGRARHTFPPPSTTWRY